MDKYSDKYRPDTTGNRSRRSEDGERYDDFGEAFPKDRDREADLPDISADETEEALKRVHQRLGFDRDYLDQRDDRDESGHHSTLRIPSRHRIAQERAVRTAGRPGSGLLPVPLLTAAAIVLLAAGLAWFLIPVTYSVAPGEHAQLNLADGSVIELNSGSRLQRSRLYGFTNRTVSLNGEAFFRVEPGSTPFLVRANGSVTEVLGTEFNVRSWSSDPGAPTRVAVLSGEVRFYPQSDPASAVQLDGGQSSHWSASSTAPEPPDSIPANRIAGWRNLELAFTEQPLSVIFDELERRFRITIELQDHSIGDSRLTTYYRSPEQVEPILRDICTVKGLRFERTSTGYLITEPGRENDHR